MLEVVERGAGLAEQGQKYLDSEASVANLVRQLPPEVQEEWNRYGHLRVEPTFLDRVFVVFRATGRNNQGAAKAPEILTTIRALNFTASDSDGCTLGLLDETNNRKMTATHLPQKLFDYPLFVSIPPFFTMRWDARQHGGRTMRSLSYLLFIKARNKASFNSVGNTYMETPNKLRDLYSHLDLKLEL